MFLLFIISAVFFVSFFIGIVLTFYLKSFIGKSKILFLGLIISFFFLVISLLLLPGPDPEETQRPMTTIAPVQEESSKRSSPQCAEAKKEIKEIQDSNTSGYAFSAVPNVGSIISSCVDYNEYPVAPGSSVWSYENCDEAFADGVSNIRAGEEGYAAHLDRDEDGIACER